jgi:tripartite-type tricarboxylate transporter receptor subunit TctC
MTLSNHQSRRFVLPLLTSLALIATGLNVQAQNWPAKPISLVVPFPSGGTTDVLARAVGQELSVALGQPVVVESKPGAGSTLGADYVAKAKPDGHTLLMGAVHHTIASSVYKKLPYDFQKDLAPISIVAMVPNVLVINTAIPARQIQLWLQWQWHRTTLDRRTV